MPLSVNCRRQLTKFSVSKEVRYDHRPNPLPCEKRGKEAGHVTRNVHAAP